MNSQSSQVKLLAKRTCEEKEKVPAKKCGKCEVRKNPAHTWISYVDVSSEYN